MLSGKISKTQTISDHDNRKALKKGPVQALFLSECEYAQADLIQQELISQVRETLKPILLFFEPKPVITAGLGIKKSEIANELRFANQAPEQTSLPVTRVSRGGRLTLHCPGQLVAFPLIPYEVHAKSIQDVLSLLEIWLRQWLEKYHIESYTRQGFTGIWIKNLVHGQPLWQKIAAIGIGARQGVSQHGIAINLTIAPSQFNIIIPCGNSIDGITNVQETIARFSQQPLPGLEVVAGELHEIFTSLWETWKKF